MCRWSLVVYHGNVKIIEGNGIAVDHIQWWTHAEVSSLLLPSLASNNSPKVAVCLFSMGMLVIPTHTQYSPVLIPFTAGHLQRSSTTPVFSTM